MDIDFESELLVCSLVIDHCVNEGHRREQLRKRIWTRNWLLQRQQSSHCLLLEELKGNSIEDFRNFLRMDVASYESLLSKVEPLIKKKDTHLRESISGHERLSATLHFLATGHSYESLKFLTYIPPQTFGRIVTETCSAILKTLKGCIKVPQNEMEWKKVADDFFKHCDFPNCIGAIDGKHIVITKPANSGSLYFNYKKNFSVVLMALVNAEYEFLAVEVGTNGRISDGGVFANSAIFEGIKNKTLNIPQPQELPGTYTKAPFVFVGDDAFPLMDNLMKPYGHRTLSEDENTFNYRLSRARRIVENTFGILSNRFRILHTQINLNPKKVSLLVLTCCYLHNYLRTVSGTRRAMSNTTSKELTADENVELNSLLSLEKNSTRNSTASAKNVRDAYRTYFNGVGSIESQ